MKLVGSRARGAALVLLLSSCGLGSDLTKITFQIPQKMYSLDTADAKRWKTPPGGVPTAKCGDGGIPDCCKPGMGVTVDCQMYPLTCEMQACVLTIKIELVQTVNLAMEAPELKNLAGQQVADVTLKTITYKLASTLNFDAPPADVYLAPATVMTSSSADAKKIGTLPMTPAGKTIEGQMTLDSGAQDAFRALAKNPAMPFNVIAVTSPKVKGGTTPMGRLDMWLGGTAELDLLAGAK